MKTASIVNDRAAKSNLVVGIDVALSKRAASASEEAANVPSRSRSLAPPHSATAYHRVMLGQPACFACFRSANVRRRASNQTLPR